MSTIDLSQLPAPDVIEALDYESLLASRKQRLLDLFDPEQRTAMEATLALESEPVTKLLEESAYTELILRQRVNDAARRVMLPYATLNHGLSGPVVDQAITLTLTTVAVSIVVHGISVTPLMDLYTRRKAGRGQRAASGKRHDQA